MSPGRRVRKSPERAAPATGPAPPSSDAEPAAGEAASGPSGETAAEAGPAPRRAVPGAAAEGRGLLMLRLGDARFGLWVDEVLEIVKTPPVSRLPLAGGEVAGVTSIRGEIIPVLDLGLRLLDAPAARPGRVVLVRHLASGSMVGLLVDAVETLLSIGEGQVREAPAAAGARLPAEYVSGVVTADEAVVTILHLGRVAAPSEAPTDEG